MAEHDSGEEPRGTGAGRALAKLRREGVRATARTAATLLAQRVWLREEHVWLLMGLDEPRPRPVLAPHLRVARVRDDQVGAVAQLGVSVAAARARLDRGHQLFGVLDGSRLVAVVWGFLGEAPTVMVPSGWLRLPAGHVNVEDTVVARELRGQGVAPAFYSVVFDDVRDQGCSWVVGKIKTENAANRRACAKLGWTEVAVVQLRRVLGRRTVTVRSLGTGRDISWLTAAATTRGPLSV